MSGACVLKPESKRPRGPRSRLRMSCLFSRWKMVQGTASLGYLLPWVSLPLQGFMGSIALFPATALLGHERKAICWFLLRSQRQLTWLLPGYLASTGTPVACSELSLSTQSQGPQTSKGHEMYEHKEYGQCCLTLLGRSNLRACWWAGKRILTLNLWSSCLSISSVGCGACVFFLFFGFFFFCLFVFWDTRCSKYNSSKSAKQRWVGRQCEQKQLHSGYCQTGLPYTKLSQDWFADIPCFPPAFAPVPHLQNHKMLGTAPLFNRSLRVQQRAALVWKLFFLRFLDLEVIRLFWLRLPTGDVLLNFPKN